MFGIAAAVERPGSGGRLRVTLSRETLLPSAPGGRRTQSHPIHGRGPIFEPERCAIRLRFLRILGSDAEICIPGHRRGAPRGSFGGNLPAWELTRSKAAQPCFLVTWKLGPRTLRRDPPCGGSPRNARCLPPGSLGFSLPCFEAPSESKDPDECLLPLLQEEGGILEHRAPQLDTRS